VTKHELIQALKDSENLSKSAAAKCVELFFDSLADLADALAIGDRVEIRGLCSFCVKNYGPYTGRNPKSGEEVTWPKNLPFFKAGTPLKRRLDG
jgi:integration host factor subunit beta